MTPTYGVQKFPEPERNWSVVVLALVLSAVVHVGMMFYFKDASLQTAGTALQDRMSGLHDEDRVPPMNVERLAQDPTFQYDELVARELPQRGVVEMSRQVDELSRSSPPALTAPPPIPREALVPGVPQLSELSIKPVDATPWTPRQEIAQIFEKTVQDEQAALPRREIPLIERVVDAPDIVPSIDLSGRQFGNVPAPPKPLESPAKIDTAPEKGFYEPPKVAAVKAPEAVEQVSASATEKKFSADISEKHEQVKGSFTQEEKKYIEEQMQAEAARFAKKDGKAATESIPPATSATKTETAIEKSARAAQEKIEQLQEAATYEPIDELLACKLEVFRDAAEQDRTYFKINVQPHSGKLVQVVPKDIIFLQDVSGSIGEFRMTYCRRAIKEAIASLNTGDRFNIIAFRDTFENCFPECVPTTEENIEKANKFAESMRAFGNTDVFGSLKSVLKFPRDPRRPMIAYVITDGKPNVGEVKSSQIIGDFTRINNGVVSVYMLGVAQQANAYLIDMLTYCNRGSSDLLRGHSSGIPQLMEQSCQKIRNPIMSDVTVTFDSLSHAEVYPRSTTNLYKDQPLELIGSCPSGTREVVCQIRGLASDKGYDTILKLDVSKDARLGKSDIKRRWVQQKMYHLMGEYARQPRQDTMAEMRLLNTRYGVKIPYEGQLK